MYHLSNFSCDFSTKRKDKLDYHKKSASKSEGIQKCNNCEFKSCTPYGLAVHMKLMHPELKSPGGRTECQRCDYSTKSRENLRSHEKHCLKSGEIKTCVHCGYKSGTTLSKHIQENHPELLKTKLFAKAKCSSCDFTTDNGKTLYKHMRICSITPKISCKECDFTSISRALLKKHFESEHKSELENDANFENKYLDASIGSQGTIKMTRLNKEAIVREKCMKQAHQKCSVKLVKSKIFHFIFN